MKLKFFIFVIFVISILTYGNTIFKDVKKDVKTDFKTFSNDKNSDKNSEKITSKDKNEDEMIKFRGNLILGTAIYPPHISNTATNNVAFIDNTIVDWTDKGDPLYQKHSPGDPGRTINDTVFKGVGLEGKLYANYSIIFKIFKTDNFILKDNNISLNFKTQLSPVSFNNGFSVSFSPIPLLIFETGGTIGLPWNIPIGTGFARNNYSGIISGEEKKILTKDSFFGPMLMFYTNMVLQFDFSFLTPKNIQRWTHIVFRLKSEFLFRTMAGLDDNIPYVWENDAGENYNGWFFYYDSLIGYRIPIVIDENFNNTYANKRFLGFRRNNNFSITLGFTANIDKMNLTSYNRSKMENKGWGSDFIFTQFGPLLLFDLPNNMFLVNSFNWKTDRVYSSNTVGNADFTKREYVDWYLYFWRIAIAFGVNF